MPLLALTAATRQQFIAFGPCIIRGLHGFNNKADSYIQLHQKIPDIIATPITDGDVPIFKSLFCPNGQAFGFRDAWFGAEGTFFNSLCLGISSTEPNYTDPGANNGLDLTIEYETEYYPNGNEVIVGDLSSGRSNLVLWTDSAANQNYRFLQATYTNNGGATRYLIGSADGGNTALPWLNYAVAAGATLQLNAGLSQQQVYSIDSSFNYHWGLKLVESTTPLLSGATSDNLSYIKALFRSSQY